MGKMCRFQYSQYFEQQNFQTPLTILCFLHRKKRQTSTNTPVSTSPHNGSHLRSGNWLTANFMINAKERKNAVKCEN